MKPDDLLISAASLNDELDNPALRILDCRFSLADSGLGLRQFQQGHIPTAQYLALEPDMSDPAGSRGRHPLPDPNRFAQTLGKLGVDNNSEIVAYDDGDCMVACRLWWMVRWLGYSNVRVLDGGLFQWSHSGFDLSSELARFAPVRFVRSEPLTRQVEAQHLLSDRFAITIDARSRQRFEGVVEPMDHTAGHVPGAMCYPFEENQGEDKCFLRDSRRFENLPQDADVVCYCGSGVSATHNIMALLLAGFNEPLLYPGSWSEWIEDPDREVASGPT